MKIGVLTSSRADYGIYFPLLQKLKLDSFFELEIIAFGTHLSKYHGYTLKEIEASSFSKVHTISSLISNDDEQSIASSYGLTALKFADFWASEKFDLVFCLGDRFEMSAAVQAGIPFCIPFAHLHGGESTLGAIDNIYRHQITLASILHFTSTETYKLKVTELTGSSHQVFTVGSLSLDGIESFKPLAKEVFYDLYKIPYDDFVLVTFHPETISSSDNLHYANEMKQALIELSNSVHLVITMPNADTMGTEYRKAISDVKELIQDKVTLVENFGKNNYFSAMSYASFLIGNTSSGILEAASFHKFVINVGNRQKGREKSKNTFDCLFTAKDITEKSMYTYSLGQYEGDNIYYKKSTVDNIISILKSKNEEL